MPLFLLDLICALSARSSKDLRDLASDCVIRSKSSTPYCLRVPGSSETGTSLARVCKWSLLSTFTRRSERSSRIGA